MAKRCTSDGKSLEKLVSRIYETLKGNPLAEVLHDVKLDNTTGRKSQFDVIIKSKVANFALMIAIECKDYSKPVENNQIHDFIVRCELVPGISRRVFVAVNGYRSGAKAVAKAKGVDLYDLKEVSPELLSGWIQVSSIKSAHLSNRVIETVTFCTKDGREVEVKREDIGRDHFFIQLGRRPQPVASVIIDLIEQSTDIFDKYASDEFGKETEWGSDGNSIIIPMPLNFNMSEKRFGIMLDGWPVELDKVIVLVNYIYSITQGSNVKVRSYKANEGQVQAEIVSGKSGEHGFEFIRDVVNGEMKMYAFHSSGQLIELRRSV
ncbi:restriction endonuclease [Spirosoma oryzicola]|uniref:restriction endonuclease n=1 Tax=Spirosoma oryzicola TaxID=2898794 RepID=UPI001E5F1E21|nr:restriction endonuclease [Spirosoma oryzicola]UHG93239.1 restriction endonuclease [Spirosoma oryzicola]